MTRRGLPSGPIYVNTTGRNALTVDSDEIIRAVCNFHTHTPEGREAFPTMAAIADGTVTAEHVRDRQAPGLKLRGNLVAEATRLGNSAGSHEAGNIDAVPWFDSREIIRWSDYHAGLMPAEVRQMK